MMSRCRRGEVESDAEAKLETEPKLKDQGLEPATGALELCYLFAGCSNSV